MISTITAILIDHVIEISVSSVFLAGFGTYVYFKNNGKIKSHKLVYYDVTDRIVKSKKIQQRINDRCGGNKNDTGFFKAA